MEDSGDYYAVLGVAPNCSQEELRAAYRRAVNFWHPDRNRTPQATEMMQLINVAYDLLRDPLRRATYDRERVHRSYSSGRPSEHARHSEPSSSRPSSGKSTDTSNLESNDKSWFWVMIITAILIFAIKAIVFSPGE